MPRLTKIVVWPVTGKPTKPWDDREETDSFLRSARRVSEAFRAALEREDVRTRHRAIELVLDSETSNGTIAVRLDEHGVVEGPESGSVTVSTGFHTLDPYMRAFYVADVLQAAARRLGAVHGWDVAAIDRAMERVRENDYEFEWLGPQVPSDDESRAVRVRAELDDDGFGRIRFGFTRSGDTGPYLSTEPIVIGTKRGDFRRVSESLLWQGANAVSARFGSRVFTIDADTGVVEHAQPEIEPRPNRAPADSAVPLPRLVVEDPPPIAFTIGGGPHSKVAPEYTDELDRLLAHIATELEWVTWWLHADIPVIDLEYWLEAKKVRTRVSVEGEVLSAMIERPRKSIAEGEEATVMARGDVLALLAEIRLHTTLDEHPELPH